MAYKPYKVGTNTPRNKRPKMKAAGNVKVFGFRSGSAWKMILALAYYITVSLIWFPSIYSEFTYLKFTGMDIILDIFKYAFIGIWLYAPLLFFSDFKYVDKLPMFKNKTFGQCLSGYILVFMFCYFMWNVDIMCMSDTYQQSYKEFSEQLQEEAESRRLENENNYENTDTTKEETTVETSTVEITTVEATSEDK